MKKQLILFCASLLLLTGCGAETESDTTPETEPVETTAVFDIPEVLTMEDTVTLPLDPAEYAGEFNKIILYYSADGPLQCVFRYDCDGETVDDLFYLEAGDGMQFAGLIEAYADNGSASALSEVSFTPLDGTVSLEVISLDVRAVPYLEKEQPVQYIENERFRLGIHLRWGGAVSYFEDKTCPLAGVDNMVNEADTGRLIQQSWYGTREQEIYAEAIYDGNLCGYNPVQGGDQFLNRSRLIDLEVTETSVYVKTQAMDWALDGHLTPSYMENTYTILEDVVRVDNRFVDFSGWEHPVTGQEIPALYTISHLDTFVWYDGASPWTGDTLTTHSELKFRSEQPSFPLKHSNTETWCAFVKTPEDYGIGLYVPSIDKWNAQRHAYDGSRDPKANSCGYVSPVNQMQIVSYRPIEYSYLLTAGSVQEIRDIFTAHRDFTDNAELAAQSEYSRIPDEPLDFTNLDFTDSSLMAVLTAPLNTRRSYDAAEGALQLDVITGYDVQFTLDFAQADREMTAEEYGKIVVEYMIPATNGRYDYGCEFFLCAGEQTAPEGGKSVKGEYIRDGQYHTLEIPLAGLDFWSGKINSVRFDYFNESADGDVFYLKSIRFEP